MRAYTTLEVFQIAYLCVWKVWAKFRETIPVTSSLLGLLQQWWTQANKMHHTSSDFSMFYIFQSFLQELLLLRELNWRLGFKLQRLSWSLFFQASVNIVFKTIVENFVQTSFHHPHSNHPGNPPDKVPFELVFNIYFKFAFKSSFELPAQTQEKLHASSSFENICLTASLNASH